MSRLAPRCHQGLTTIQQGYEELKGDGEGRAGLAQRLLREVRGHG